MQKRVFVIPFVAGFLLVIAACFCLFRLTSQKPAEKLPPRGLFEWDELTAEHPEDTLELIQKLQITRWYQEFPDNAEISPAFVEFLHKQKVSVYALMGSVDWGYEADGASLRDALSRVAAYNKDVSAEQRIDGVMLDVEPYVTSYWDPEQHMKQYVDGMAAAYESVRGEGLRVVICIPRHYDDRGSTDELERLISSACDEVAVMDYDCGNEVEKIRTEAELAFRHNKELHCILEFQEVGKHGLVEEKTYRNKGLEAAGEAFRQVDAAFPDQQIVWDYHCAAPISQMLAEG